MRKLGMLLLTLSMLLLYIGSGSMASAHTNDVNSPEETLLSETENEISPFVITCGYYYDGNHRYVKTGESPRREYFTERVTIKRPDGSTAVVDCTITNHYMVPRYTCACGDYFDSNKIFSHTTHSVNH